MARDQTTPFSDVDIALIIVENSVPKDKQLHFELNIEIKISDTCSIPNADVRIVNGAPIMVRGEVVTHGILLYSTDEKARVEFETRAMSEYFDYYPTYEFFRRAYFTDIRKRGLVRV